MSSKNNQEKGPNLSTPHNEVVTLLIGQAQEKFTIHKTFLAHHSPFFKAAFKGAFQEGLTQSMTLKEVEPRVFGFLQHWLYTQSIAVPSSVGEGSSWPSVENLIRLWVAGEMFIIPALQDKVVMCLMRGQSFMAGAMPISLKQVEWVYANTSENAPLRRFVLHRFSQQCTAKDLDMLLSDPRAQYRLDLVQGWMKDSQSMSRGCLVNLTSYFKQTQQK